MTTVNEIFELRRHGRVEEAYEAARRLHASDKSPIASSAMFWTAVDILEVRIGEGRQEEATKILMALERLLPHVPDREGCVRQAFERSTKLLQTSNAKEDGSEERAEHLQLGAWGEEVATIYLREKGYVILERDWHSGHRDIDIITYKDGVVVFIEVKTRCNTEFGAPEQNVDYEKQANLRHAINHYVKSHRIEVPIRFDIVTVVGTLDSISPTINHIENVAIMR